jgi:hypothetical protein
VPVRSAIHQSNLVSLRIRDKHIETLPEAELAHDIVREIAEPISHILDIALLVICLEIPIIASKY